MKNYEIQGEYVDGRDVKEEDIVLTGDTYYFSSLATEEKTYYYTPRILIPYYFGYYRLPVYSYKNGANKYSFSSGTLGLVELTSYGHPSTGWGSAFTQYGNGYKNLSLPADTLAIPQVKQEWPDLIVTGLLAIDNPVKASTLLDGSWTTLSFTKIDDSSWKIPARSLYRDTENSWSGIMFNLGPTVKITSVDNTMKLIGETEEYVQTFIYSNSSGHYVSLSNSSTEMIRRYEHILEWPNLAITTEVNDKCLTGNIAYSGDLYSQSLYVQENDLSSQNSHTINSSTGIVYIWETVNALTISMRINGRPRTVSGITFGIPFIKLDLPFTFTSEDEATVVTDNSESSFTISVDITDPTRRSYSFSKSGMKVLNPADSSEITQSTKVALNLTFDYDFPTP